MMPLCYCYSNHIQQICNILDYHFPCKGVSKLYLVSLIILHSKIFHFDQIHGSIKYILNTENSKKIYIQDSRKSNKNVDYKY